MAEHASTTTHKVEVNARTRAELSGVCEVKSFDEVEVVLTTSCGELTVEGEGLHVSTLDMTRGAVVIDGTINGLYYESDLTERRGLFGRRRR